MTLNHRARHKQPHTRRPRRAGRGGSTGHRAAVAVEPLEDRITPSFLPPVAYAVGQRPVEVAAGYFNGDEALDVVTANSLGNTLSVLLGRGDGSFQDAIFSPTEAQPRALSVADFDGDGLTDVVLAYAQGLSVLRSNGEGTFEVLGTYPVSGQQVRGVAVGDFDGNGAADLLATAVHWGGGFFVFLGRGRGTFEPKAVSTAGTFAGAGVGLGAFAVGDVNEDGLDDIAVAVTRTFCAPELQCPAVLETAVGVWLSAGDGSFAPGGFATPASSFHSITDVVVADVNGDGKRDVVASWDAAVLPAVPGEILVALGVGDGTLRQSAAYPVGPAAGPLAVGDFNGDAVIDLAAGTRNAIDVLSGQGDGTFLPAQTLVVGTHPRALAVGDFDGDGFDDLAGMAFVTGLGDIVFVLLNDGDWEN